MFNKVRFYILIVFIAFLLLFQAVSVFGILNVPDDPDIRAIELFEEGKFREALPIFEDLVKLYPDDKRLNYYLGACLLETKNYGTKARQALLMADENISGKVDYYLGIAFHAENDFLKALDYYHRFEKNAKNKLKRTIDYENLIVLCEQGVNPFIQKKEEIFDSKPIELVDTLVEQELTEPKIIEDSINVEEIFIIPEELFDSVITFQVTPEIHYMKISQFKTPEAQVDFVKGWLKKKELDSLIQATDQLRKKYDQSTPELKEILTSQILSNEQQLITLNRDIPGYDLQAQQLESEYWKDASSEEKEQLIFQNKAVADSLEQLYAEKQKEISKLPPESVIVPVIEKAEPKEEISPDKGIIYKIQIGAFSKEPPDWVKRLYKKLSLIRKISNYTDEDGITVYTVGELRSYEDAVEMQKQVKIEGVKDAIVAAYQDGKRIKVSKARKINGE